MCVVAIQESAVNVEQHAAHPEAGNGNLRHGHWLRKLRACAQRASQVTLTSFGLRLKFALPASPANQIIPYRSISSTSKVLPW